MASSLGQWTIDLLETVALAGPWAGSVTAMDIIAAVAWLGAALVLLCLALIVNLRRRTRRMGARMARLTEDLAVLTQSHERLLLQHLGERGRLVAEENQR